MKTNLLDAGDGVLTQLQLLEWLSEQTKEWGIANQKILLIVPDQTRTAPLGVLFKAFCELWLDSAAQMDVLIALGTHPPMTEEAIEQRLEISRKERLTSYGKVRFFNHVWDDPTQLRTVGHLTGDVVSEITDGLFSLDVAVSISSRIFDYDQIVIMGPVYPHEVVGFSAGNKYLFPGISGAEITNFFHWLGAIVTNPEIIGKAYTPVRAVVDRAASFVQMPKRCFCMVTNHEGDLAAVSAGTPEEAWEAAWPLAEKFHVSFKPKPFHTILSCAPEMYDELWVAGKCMYKLEPILADGGELIIYAPHLSKISDTHGELIRSTGYHCRDFFLKQWEKYKQIPWGVLAHCTHVYGGGTYDLESGLETPRARVTLASQIPEAVCKELNLGYRDPASLSVQEYAGREDEGVLLVPRAGEMLFRIG
ncbi:MAG: lactate racemase domain-containing protein [Limisphaerales bacterium]|jgi:nickel-dependent lactate racemase|nr:lactate racemase domain-containing protein [Verrucomicrobiota bacterium]